MMESAGLQIWYVFSHEDSYFVGIVMADNEDRAREIAWDEYTQKTRPREWMDYHKDSSGFDVTPLGYKCFGSDGNSRFEP